MGGLVGAIYGMNLHNGFESSRDGPLSSLQYDEVAWNASAAQMSSAAKTVGVTGNGWIARGLERFASRADAPVIASWVWIQVVVGTSLGTLIGASLTAIALLRLGVFMR